MAELGLAIVGDRLESGAAGDGRRSSLAHAGFAALGVGVDQVDEGVVVRLRPLALGILEHHHAVHRVVADADLVVVLK